MLKPKAKILAVFLMLLEIFLIETSYTDADIFAERIVRENKFSAIDLDFSISSSFGSGLIASIFQTLGVQPGGYDLGAIRVRPENGKNFKYHFKAVRTNGDERFCNELELGVFNRNFSELFEGKLMDLSVDSRLSNLETKDFIFFASLENSDPEIKNKICEFNFSVKTYRENPDEQGGIFAEKFLNNVISSGDW